VSDIKDESILDQHDAALTITNVETPNTFGQNLFRRLGLAQGSEAEATSSSSNNETKILKMLSQDFSKHYNIILLMKIVYSLAHRTSFNFRTFSYHMIVAAHHCT